MKKIFVLLLTVLISILSIGNLYANSGRGHNTMAIYCIWKMTQDSSFMPSISGEDRKELTSPDIVSCEKWDDLSNAQKAFIQGANLPDSFGFMQISHNEAPMEVLSAMYTLMNICPKDFSSEPENVKAEICRMQKYMSWGSKLHIEMDKITHAKLPYAGYNMYKHVWIERLWDLELCKRIFEQNMGPYSAKTLGNLKGFVFAFTSFK